MKTSLLDAIQHPYHSPYTKLSPYQANKSGMLAPAATFCRNCCEKNNCPSFKLHFLFYTLHKVKMYTRRMIQGSTFENQAPSIWALPKQRLPPPPALQRALWGSSSLIKCPKSSKFFPKKVPQTILASVQTPPSTLLHHVALWYLGAETDDHHRNPNSK